MGFNSELNELYEWERDYSEHKNKAECVYLSRMNTALTLEWKAQPFKKQEKITFELRTFDDFIKFYSKKTNKKCTIAIIFRLDGFLTNLNEFSTKIIGKILIEIDEQTMFLFPLSMFDCQTYWARPAKYACRANIATNREKQRETGSER